MEIRRLLPGDDRSSFESGDEAIDRFFRQFAGQNQFRHNIGVTWIGLISGEIVAYVSISAASIEVEELPPRARKHLPGYPASVLRLARMGVAGSRQGAGLGSLMMDFVFEESTEMRDRLGCIGVLVDAKEQAVGFYQRFGFTPIFLKAGAILSPRRIVPMFLSIKAIANR